MDLEILKLTLKIDGDNLDVNMFCRPNTSDSFVCKEVLCHNAYRKLNIYSSDIVADIGANIGAFTIWALLHGASVIAFEPDPDNYRLLVKNVASFREQYPVVFDKANVVCHFKEAIVGHHKNNTALWINEKRNKGLHSIVRKRGRFSILVSSKNINTILDSIRPTVIKMDIEGGEYECIKDAITFFGVREFICEFHHDHLRDIKTHEKYNEIIRILRQHFSFVLAKEDTKKAWVSLIYCKS